MKNYSVQQIPSAETHDWLLRKHYARRIPSITWAFGLFDARMTLQGVCTFGTPASSTLLKGVCGEQWSTNVCELNRLVINESNVKNLASFFVSKSMALLPYPKIVVSYADTKLGHHGYVYQATNFIYTGLSTRFIDPVITGHEAKHHATMAHGMSKAEVDAKYGDKVQWVERSRKHRYIFLHGNKSQRRAMLADLRYKQNPYPKGENKRYDASYQPSTQQILF
jgi:plastocyanin